jgi:hypothetical protein
MRRRHTRKMGSTPCPTDHYFKARLFRLVKKGYQSIGRAVCRDYSNISFDPKTAECLLR